MIKSEIKEQLQGSPCVALLSESDSLLMTGSRTWLQQDLFTALVGFPSPWKQGTNRMLGYGATRVAPPLTLGWGIPILALCFSAPTEERSCSWLNPWVFFVSALVIKTAFVTVCLGGFQCLLISLGWRGWLTAFCQMEKQYPTLSASR